MTPPISPAALMHRDSVINQGPMVGGPSPSLPPSSSSLPPSSVMTQPSSSYPDGLYPCLSLTSAGFCPAGGGSSAPNYHAGLRSALIWRAGLSCFWIRFMTRSPVLGSRSQTESLAPVQPLNLPRYPPISGPHMSKNMYYGHHAASTNHSFSSVPRPVSNYIPSSDSAQPNPGLDPQILEPVEGFGFAGGELNLVGVGCQGQPYPGHSGKN